MSDLELYLLFVDSFKKKIEQIAIKKERCRQEEYWRELPSTEFELEVGKWYLSKGYEVRVTKPSKDGGVDIVLTKDDKLTFVQCKHYKKKVDVTACRELVGVMHTKNVKRGEIVALNGVTNEAKKFCGDAGIKIVTLRTLIKSNKENQQRVLRSLQKLTLPFRSNLPTPYEEREVYGYYIYGDIFQDYEQAAEEIEKIPIANLTNLFDTKAIVKYQDRFFIIYSSLEKIKWLGNYILRYVDAQSGQFVSLRRLQ